MGALTFGAGMSSPGAGALLVSPMTSAGGYMDSVFPGFIFVGIAIGTIGVAGSTSATMGVPQWDSRRRVWRRCGYWGVSPGVISSWFRPSKSHYGRSQPWLRQFFSFRETTLPGVVANPFGRL